MRLRIILAVLGAIMTAGAGAPQQTSSGDRASAADATRQDQAADPTVAAAGPAATPSNIRPPATVPRDGEASRSKPGIARGVPDDYKIGSGDVLQIAVWKEPEVSVPSVVVRPDGKIAMPLIKDVEVGGLTPAEAERTITGRLDKLITGADVTVVVTTINSKKVYVMGGVKKEGAIPYSYRMTVLQAISEAGGLGDYASRKKIYVLRTVNGQSRRLPFNYDQVIKGRSMEQNIELLPGDTLVIPQ